MKKILPVIVILVIIAAALAGWFLMVRNKKTANQENNQNNQQMTQNETEGDSFTGKIKDAFMKGLPMKCTYKMDDQNYSTGYLKNKKYYAEVVVRGKMSYLVLIDNCMWTWNKEDKANGVKMCFAQQENEDMWSSFEQNQEAADYNYNCSPAIINDAIFNLPADVKFINMDDLMDQATQGMGQFDQEETAAEEEEPGEE